GYEASLDGDVMGAGSPHPQRSPVVMHLHSSGVERNPEVQDRRTRLRVLGDRARHQKVARRSTAAEDLSCVDAVATVYLFRRPRAVYEVRLAGRDEDQLLPGDAP